jgi:CBS domain containing-hemolysin-like protein
MSPQGNMGYNGEDMMLLMLLLVVVFFALLLIVTAVDPKRSTLSLFELQRRQSNGESAAKEILHREVLLDDTLSLQRVLSALLLVIVVTLTISRFGWMLGLVIAVAVAIEYGAVARIGVIQRFSQRLYERYEQSILHFVEKFGGIIRFMRHNMPNIQKEMRLESREELEYLVAESRGIVTADEKSLLTHGLQFGRREVHEIMTPRGVIDSIDSKELLGPLVLDDLHKTGHSRFPVIEKDIDHVVGVLYAQDLLNLDIKRSVTAGKAMDPHVYYIHEHQTLQHALAAFLRSHRHLFIVVNEFEETVGLLSLEDTIEALIGRTIVDEFDRHNDLRAVAKRNPRRNNQPKNREDV